MYHIDEERLFELALDDQLEPKADESSHLVECRMCSERFAQERRLTASIEAIPQLDVPMGFAAKTAELFERARVRKVRVAPWLVFGLVTASIITSLMLWTIIASPSVFISQTALALGKAEAFIRAMALVFSRVPYAAEVTTTFSGAIVLISAGLLAGLSKRAQQVK